MVANQGDIWWVDFGEPIGSSPGYRRPAVIVQRDSLNRSRVATTLCVPLTTNLRWRDAPGNVMLRAADTALDRDSVANVSQLTAIDKSQLIEPAGRVDRPHLSRIFAGIDEVLGR